MRRMAPLVAALAAALLSAPAPACPRGAEASQGVGESGHSSHWDTHLMCAYIGTLSVPMYAQATRPTAPHAPSATPAPQFPSHRTLRASAGRAAPGARAAGLTRSHPSQGKDKWQEHRWIEAQSVFEILAGAFRPRRNRTCLSVVAF